MSTNFLTARITSSQLYSQNRISQHNGIPKEVQYPRSNEYPRKWNIQGKEQLETRKVPYSPCSTFYIPSQSTSATPKQHPPPPIQAPPYTRATLLHHEYKHSSPRPEKSRSNASSEHHIAQHFEQASYVPRGSLR